MHHRNVGTNTTTRLHGTWTHVKDKTAVLVNVRKHNRRSSVSVVTRRPALTPGNGFEAPAEPRDLSSAERHGLLRVPGAP